MASTIEEQKQQSIKNKIENMLFNRFHRNHNAKYSNKCVTRSSATLLITRISFLLLLLLQNTYLVTNAQADFGGEEGEDDFGE